MIAAFDHGQPQVYFTANFWKHHIYVSVAGGKRRAEDVFLRRPHPISTVVCLTRLELVQLAAEIHRRQTDYSDRPDHIFTTVHPYDFWVRGGLQATPIEEPPPKKPALW